MISNTCSYWDLSGHASQQTVESINSVYSNDEVLCEEECNVVRNLTLGVVLKLFVHVQVF